MRNPRVRLVIIRNSIAALAGVGYYLYNGPYLDIKKDVAIAGGYSSYFFGEKKPGFIVKDLKVTPHLQKLIEEVKQEYVGCDEAKNRIMFSLHRESEPRNFGSSWSGRAFVVLPEYLSITSVDDLNASKVNSMLEDTYGWKVPRTDMWFSDHGKLLVDSFLLSDQAKKYIIAREMASTFNNDTYLMTFMITASVTVYHLMLSMMEKRKKPPSPAEMTSYTVICALTATLFVYMSNMQRAILREQNGNLFAVTRGRTSSKEAGKRFRNYEKVDGVDEDYHRGGVEYYNKVIQRNLALRNLIRSLPYSMSNPVFYEDGSYKKHFWTVEISASDQLEKLHDWSHGRKTSKSASAFSSLWQRNSE